MKPTPWASVFRVQRGPGGFAFLPEKKPEGNPASKAGRVLCELTGKS